MVEPWVVGSQPSERFPLWTRANVGEVFPDPVSRSYHVHGGVGGGWLARCPRRDGRLHPRRVHRRSDGDARCLRLILLSQCLHHAHLRRALVFRHRPWTILFFGAQPGVPSYEPAPGDQNEARTAAIGAKFTAVMSAEHLEALRQVQGLVDRLHVERPDLESMSNRALRLRHGPRATALPPPVCGTHLHIVP